MADDERIDIMNTLKRSEIFLGLEDEQLERIAALSSIHEKKLQAGEFLFRSGETANNLYVLKDGRINLVAGVSSKLATRENNIVVDIVTIGGSLGWSALVAPHSYTLSAIADIFSTVVCINGSELTALSKEDYHIGYRIYSGLARIIGSRLRDYEQVFLRGRRWPFVNRNDINP